MNVEPIVVGADGSEESLQAVEWAAGEAILHAVPLRIVSAALLPPVMTALQIRPDRDHVADFIRSECDLALDAAASRTPLNNSHTLSGVSAGIVFDHLG